ncbi:hypothetical protein DBR32_06915 [Taibaiella sp. KBW10]|uniref:DUF481 domain-containing protein n=1 Tax=Taibaiella sp. KBW10 TaxID=2153357 RepID=UPI000F5A912C|nr:DUF481 domain-containing protein [Taibaiella sp. KBW10]RQO31672.1 hypothetical protein DBR32_06915 [Taibaiella sp. KBW10]
MKIKFQQVILLLLILGNKEGLYAQFNDSTHYMAAVQSSGSFNKTNDGFNALYNNSIKYGMKFNSFIMNANSSWVYGKTPVKLSNNDWNTSLDFNLYKTLPHFYYWGLLNHASSYSLKINNQFQGGLGIAYRFFDRPNIRLSVSNGILYETSSIIQEQGHNLDYETFRNSLRVQFNYTFKELVKLRTVGFYQPSLTLKNDFIINANASVQIKVWKWVQFSTTATYNKVSRTNRENFILTYGLVAERFF